MSLHGSLYEHDATMKWVGYGFEAVSVRSNACAKFGAPCASEF